MNQSPPRIIITGDLDFAEFEWAFDRRLPDCEFCNLASLLADQENLVADLVVLCQSHRGSIDLADAEQLQAACPTAARVLLLGSFCEGELRSGKPVAGWYRRFWYQWEFFIDSFLDAHFAGQPHPAALPSTAIDADRFELISKNLESNHRLFDATSPQNLVVGVFCRWQTQWELYRDLLVSSGLTAVRIESNSSCESVDRLLIDGDSLDGPLVKKIEELVTDRDVQTVLLLNFPRLDEVQLATDLGIDVVVGRPFLNDELVSAIIGRGSFIDQRSRPNQQRI